MNILKKIGIVIIVALLTAQFFGPEKNDGELDTVNAFIAETNPPKDVLKILNTTCFDCHSSKTNYPWYNNITPVNYWLDEHVQDGKKHLNFSEWAAYNKNQKEHILKDLKKELKSKEMPLNSYLWIHKDAKMSTEQYQIMLDWVKTIKVE